MSAVERLDVGGHGGGPGRDYGGGASLAAGLTAVGSARLVFLFSVSGGQVVTLRVARRRWRKSPCSG